MKKSWYTIFIFLLFSFSGFGQVVDTAAVVREVDSLTEVSWNLTNKKLYDEAIRVGGTAIRLASEALGNQHKLYGTAAFTLGRAYHAQGKYDLSEPLYLEALSVRGKIHGKEHMDYCMVLTKIGTLYGDLGRYEEAEPLLIQAKEIPVKVYGKEHRDYVVGLLNLGNLYNEISRLEEAEKLFIEAKDIQERALGKETRDYAATLNNLANLYKSLGRFEEAELYYRQAIDIRGKVVGKENVAHAGNLNNLSNLIERLGRFDEAETLLLEAKKVYETTNSTQTIGYGGTLNNLGRIYQKMGKFEQAESYLLAGMKEKEKTAGKETPAYATSLSNLGFLYLKMGRYAEARELLLGTEKIRKEVLGDEHPSYAVTLCNLGQVCFNTGRAEEAESYFITSRNIYEKVYGKEHPDYASVLSYLSKLYDKTSRVAEARLSYDELNSINKKLHLKIIRHSSLQEIEAYSTLLINRLYEFYSLALRTNKIYMDHNGRCFNNALFYNSFALESSIKIKTIARSDSVAEKKLELLTSYHRRLAKEYVKPVSQQKGVAELDNQANTLEKDLAHTVTGFKDIFRQVDWTDVRSALHPGEAAIEFIHFNYCTPEPTDSVLYAALLLKPGMPHPKFIPLCTAKDLTALLPASGGLNADQVNGLYSGNDDLYRLIWAPLERELQGTRLVYCAPSGLLHRLHLGAIPTAGNKTVSDRFQVITLGSTRQLVFDPTAGRAPTAASAIIYGGVQFDPDSAVDQLPTASPDAGAGQRGALSFDLIDSTLRGGHSWPYLKWSDKEADNIRAVLAAAGIATEVRKGAAATEESFKQIGQSGASPRILHVSTHGYFFPDPATPHSALRTPHSDEPIFKLSEHPMIRSGLILAGANQAWSTPRGLGTPTHREDGVLTAYEISQLDLRHTELVVLSACETGLGDIQGNEGVYGLQRAFKIAGARHVMMSLWQVPDYQTQEMMTVFYQKMLVEQLPVLQALRAAQEAMRAKRYEPYYWAGFVIVE